MCRSDKRGIFRLFASGKTPQQVVEALAPAVAPDEGRGTDALRKVERLYETYLSLPIGQKQQLTLMPDCVSDRRHRLMDDISDLRRVDALLETTVDGKEIVSLLDIKRKIKERMAKESAPASENQAMIADEEAENELEQRYREIIEARFSDDEMY